MAALSYLNDSSGYWLPFGPTIPPIALNGESILLREDFSFGTALSKWIRLCHPICKLSCYWPYLYVGVNFGDSSTCLASSAFITSTLFWTPLFIGDLNLLVSLSASFSLTSFYVINFILLHNWAYSCSYRVSPLAAILLMTLATWFCCCWCKDLRV